MDLTKDFKNQLLERREIQFSLKHESNPGFEHVTNHIAEKLKTEADAIAIKSLKNNFGTNDFLIEAFVYNSAEHKNKIEPKPKVKKKAGA